MRLIHLIHWLGKLIRDSDGSMLHQYNYGKNFFAFYHFYIDCVFARVLNVLRQWVEHHYADFERDPALLKQLTVFLDTVKGKALRKWIDSIHRALHRQVRLCIYNFCPSNHIVTSI